MLVTRLQSDSITSRMLKGAGAGLIATVPMTLSMILGWRLLPAREKYPLPPQQITEEFAERLNIKDHVNAQRRDVTALILHFMYGMTAGSMYGLLEQKIPLEERFKGSLAGLLLWIGSYLGWLPIFGILRPATQHPWRRNLLMIWAHLIWGATLGEAHRKLITKY
jgi:putative membrane protein